MKKLLLLLFILQSIQAFTQDCDCEKELRYIKNFIEENYAGFRDKQATMTKPAYEAMAARYLAQASDRKNKDQCLLLISSFLDGFKDSHIQIAPRFDATKNDSLYISQRPKVKVPDTLLARLQSAKTAEGIYLFNYDSSYRIAFYKDPETPGQYLGVILDAKLPGWQQGMVKLIARPVGDSLLKGVLYMRNHMPKVEWFYLGRNSIGGDWQREGTRREPNNYVYEPVAGKKLSDKTLYLKIRSFSPSNAKNIDSLIKACETQLKTMPNLVLDLRDNGGGADFAYGPLIPYLYTNPVTTIGVDVLSTEQNIKGWKMILENKDIPEATRNNISRMIDKMENNKGRLVNIVEDETDSSDKVMEFPKKIVVLINENCASTTEQFLLLARQSRKVILAGQPTQGVLDYSNMRETPFSCMPYILKYATTRSRRLDLGQGIDNAGIQPNIPFGKGTDWVQQAQQFLEK